MLLILALSFAAVALIINGALQLPSSHDLATLCAERVSLPTPEPEACAEAPSKEASTTPFPPSLAYPGFLYPSHWQVIGNTTLFSQGVYGFTLQFFDESLYFTSCDHPLLCSKNPSPLLTLSQDPLPQLEAEQTQEMYVQQRYSTSQNVVITKDSPQENHTRYVVTGTDASSGSFRHILIFGSFSLVDIRYQPTTLSATELAQVDALLTSLDLSLLP